MMHWPLLAALFVAQVSVARHHHPRNVANTAPKIDVSGKLTVTDARTGISYNPYSKNHPGRHVCSHEKEVLTPIKTKQAYIEPKYNKFTERCNINQLCTAIRVVYETSYKDVETTKKTTQLNYICCPGWKQINVRSFGCNRPLCSHSCLNGGHCVKPEHCNCAKGFKGRTCESDVDECKDEKPCDQICINTPGSFKCQCRENFNLHTDGQTCQKDGNDIGFEAKELQFEALDERLRTLENFLEGNKNGEEFKQIENNMEVISNDLNKLKGKITALEHHDNDLSEFRTRLQQIEKKTIKVDELSARYDKMKRCAFYNKICI